MCWFWNSCAGLSIENPKLALNLLLKEQQFATSLYGNYNPGRVIWVRVERSSEAGRVKGSFISTFAYFFLILPKFRFWSGGWALGYVSTRIWDFPNISLFPMILSLKSFGNSWGNSYTNFAILDTTFRFTCG